KMHIDDARSGREFLRRLAPHVASAADWWNATDAWIAVAISYTGLVALEVPEESLQSFPEAFRVGMAARADILLDRGENDPKKWDKPFGNGRIHIAVSIFSDTEESGAAPWRWRGSSTRDSPELPCWRLRTSAPSRGTSIRSATRTV